MVIDKGKFRIHGGGSKQREVQDSGVLDKGRFRMHGGVPNRGSSFRGDCDPFRMCAPRQLFKDF